MRVAAILLSWKREKNLQAVVDGLKKQSWITDIILFNNHPSTIRPAGVKVITSDINFRCLIRHKLAEMLDYDFFVFQDDDLCLTQDIGPVILPHINELGKTSILGLCGRNLSAWNYEASPYTKGDNIDYVHSPTPVHVVKGRFHIISREGIAQMSNSPFNSTHLKLEDDIRANVIVQNWSEKPSYVLPIKPFFKELPDDHALWKEKAHSDNRNLAVKEALTLGWKP